MKIINKHLFILFCLLSVAFVPDLLYSQSVAHQTGIYYGDLLPTGMQKTHEARNTIYVNPASTGTVTLSLPSQGSSSPHHYFRWFDYQTNSSSPQLQSGGTLYDNGRVVYGGSEFYTINYTISGATLPDFIASDVSANTDYTITNNTVLVEPTLSYRNIFEIRDANEIATQLKDLTDANKYLEDKIVYMPAVLASTKERARVTLKYDDNNYFGYTESNSLTSSGSINVLHVSGSPTNPNKSGRFIYMDPGPAGTESEIIVTKSVGSGGDARTYNIARFRVIFIAESPDEFTTIGSRSLDFLDKNYVLLGKLDFDYNKESASAENNMWKSPLPYNICSYGFASEILYNEGKRGLSNKVALWNEYGFYKTANVPLGLNGYTWYNSGNVVYDRLHDISGGTQDGYFMYIDAAQSPGILAQIPITELCAGTRLFVSAAVASLTQNEAQSYPDLNFVFMGIDANGNETELNRYTSGDIPSHTAGGPTPWHQMYYSFTFQESTSYVSYRLQVENNCTSTNGGDYAIDDIRLYRSKPAVQAYQMTLPCDDEAPKVKIRIEYEKLLSTLGLSEVTSGSGQAAPIRYKFLDSDYNPISYNYGIPSNPLSEYGIINISTNFSEMTALSEGVDPPLANGDPATFAYTETETLEGVVFRYIVFSTPNTDSFSTGPNYYTVIGNDNNEFETNICGLISDPFSVIPASVVTVDGESWTQGDEMCYGNTITIGAKLKDRSDPTIDIVCLFDWYLKSQIEFESVIPGSTMSAKDALGIYRSIYDTPSENDGLSTDYQGSYTVEVHNLLDSLIEKGLLIINKKEISVVIRENARILAIPIINTAETSGDILNLCANIIRIDASAGASNPTMVLGNAGFKSLRMDLAQLNDLKSVTTKTLSIPIFDFKNADGTKTKALVKSADDVVRLIATNDPNAPAINPGDASTFIDVARTQSVDIDPVTGGNVVLIFPYSFAFREGYEYTVQFHFNQVTAISEVGPCDGTAVFSIKIVPEYLTWTGKEGDNWNNDGNWKRSDKEELYKSSYTNDPDSHGFAPMKGTKVTIQKLDNGATLTNPWLYKLEGTPFLDMENTNYTNSADKLANAATDSIEYDMVAKANGNNYDCENFYGNTCDQIYFKSLAEMRNTNFLKYNKAHIDFELASGRWYMLSSPLKGVVAGDMYLPSANGRQETEAFEPIVFNTSLHNRFNPPVYQRSWDKAGSWIFELDGTQQDAYISTDWSKVYNKVDELYDGATGFSILSRYGVSSTDKVLFRLPKDDLSFSYYSYDGATGNTTTIDRTTNGRLVFENEAANVVTSIANQDGANNIFLVGNPFVATLDMKLFFDANSDFERKYWIVTENGISTVQIAIDGLVTSSGPVTLGRYLSPVQSFFVERTDASATTSVTFAPEMTVAASVSGLGGGLKSSNTPNQDDNPYLRIEAKRNGIRSNILILQKDDASNTFDTTEDAQALMDSNLSDSLVLYSMAGERAALINVVKQADTILLGIKSNEKTDVTLTFNGVGSWLHGVSLYDSHSGKKYLLNEGDSVSVVGKSHNRYLLTFYGNETDPPLIDDGSVNIYSPEKGIVVVETSPQNKQENIKVYTLNGQLIRDIKASGNSTSISLTSGGVYIIRVADQQNRVSKKVYCK